jgi:hypothetical protein
MVMEAEAEVVAEVTTRMTEMAEMVKEMTETVQTRR